MINPKTKEQVLKHIQDCEKQLEAFRDRAPAQFQGKINVAFAGLSAAQIRIDENRDFEEVLYFIGRVHWTLGFISGVPKPKNTESDTPLADALIKS